MGNATQISWTDHAFSPWWGCQHAGPGCDHCYAEAMDHRFGGDHFGPGKERRRTSDATWNNVLRLDRQARNDGVRRRIFPSMCDPFDNAVPEQWRADFWDLIRMTPNLTWLLLTKRIGNVRDMLPAYWGNGGWPNVAIGATVVNQEEYYRDMIKLARINAACRFLSIEPMLGPIGLSQDAMRYVHWVIVGGESGPGARPMRPEWPRHIRDQCATAGVPFHFKQWGGVTKKATGYLLDGVEHREFPA